MEWEKIGIGGIFALLVIREVLNFLKIQKGNGSGDKAVEFWQMEIRRIVREEIHEAFTEIRSYRRGKV